MAGGGIPGLRGGDHVGITVPDLAQAHEFLVDVLGCQHVYSLPAMRHDDDWMLDHLNVDPRRVVNEIRFYRCGNGLNFEVFEYAPHEGQREAPRNSDIGGHHVAFYVDDMDAAVEYLRGARRPAAGRARRQQERLGRAALAVLPRPLGDAVRAGQLPRRQGLRGRRGRAAVASVTDSSVASDRIADTLRAAILDGSYLPGDADQAGGRRRAVRREPHPGPRGVPAAGLRGPGHAGGQHRRLGDPAVPGRVRRDVPDQGAARAAAAARVAAEPGRGGDRAAGRAHPGDGGDGRRRRRNFSASTGSSTCQATRAPPPGETSQIIGRMWNTTQHYRREFTKLAAGAGAGMDVTHLEHRLLLDCIGRRDADDAERVLVTHIRRTRLALEQHPEIFG